MSKHETDSKGIASPSVFGAVVPNPPHSLAELAGLPVPKRGWRQQLEEKVEDAPIQFMGIDLVVRYRPAVLTPAFADKMAKAQDATQAEVFADACLLVVAWGEEGDFETATPEALAEMPPTFLQALIAGISNHAVGGEDLDPQGSGGSFV